MNKILLPTDLSELGDFAYNLAQKIAEKTGAKIDVPSIVNAPANAVFDQDGNIKTDTGHDISSYIQERANLSKKLEKWCSDKKDIAHFEVKIGRVEEDILQYAKKNDIDLLVMGTHGAGGIKELLTGSNAQKVVRQCNCPVLTLKCDRSGLEIKDMLLAGDFHKPEKRNLDLLKELQKVFDAKFHLLMINTPKNFETQRRAMVLMEEFAEINDLKNVAFHLYSDTNVETGLANFSADSGIDFLCMGTSQRKGALRILRHSISEDAVNHLWQPILTFPINN